MRAVLLVLRDVQDSARHVQELVADVREPVRVVVIQDVQGHVRVAVVDAPNVEDNVEVNALTDVR